MLIVLAIAGGCQPGASPAAKPPTAITQPEKPLPVALQRLVDAGASVTARAHHKYIPKIGPLVRFHDQLVSADAVAYLRDVHEPLFLHFHRCCFLPGALKPLDGMRNVVLLGGDEDLAIDDVLADVSTLPGLEEMFIDGWCGGTARGLALLKSAEHLQQLRVSGNGLDDRVLALLADHKDLTFLMMASKSITDDGLRHLSHLTRLGDLTLNDCQITDEGLGHLAGCEQLAVLTLERTRITGSGFSKLRSLRHLRGLYLSGSQVTDAGLAGIAALGSLEGAELSGTQVTDAGLGQLGRHPLFAWIAIRRTRVTDAGIASFPRSCRWDIDAFDTEVTQAAERFVPKARLHRGPSPR